jgi:hydroxymethylglutaryl-CoA lyase
VLEALAARVSLTRIALHFHDTYGMAAANVLAGLDAGVQAFDASAGGLGGCPFAPGAAGNLAMEDLLYLLQGMGQSKTIDLDRVVDATTSLEPLIGHPLPSRVRQAILARRARTAAVGRA